MRTLGSQDPGPPGDPTHHAVADSIHASLADEVAWHLKWRSS